MRYTSFHAGKFRPRIAHETGTGIWHLSHLARAARCDDDFFRFLAQFFLHLLESDLTVVKEGWNWKRSAKAKVRAH